MNTSHPDRDEAKFADTLKRQASDLAPDFSPLLHARIMQRVNQAKAAPASRMHPAVRWSWIPLAAAAAIAAVLILNHNAATPTSPGPAPQVAQKDPKNVPSIPVPVADIGKILDHAPLPTDQQLEETRLALLDQDAQRFANFVIDRLSFASGK